MRYIEVHKNWRGFINYYKWAVKPTPVKGTLYVWTIKCKFAI